MCSNELKKKIFFEEVTHIFIFSIQLFFYIWRYSFVVLQNFIFNTLNKTCPYKSNRVICEVKVRRNQRLLLEQGTRRVLEQTLPRNIYVSDGQFHL